MHKVMASQPLPSARRSKAALDSIDDDSVLKISKAFRSTANAREIPILSFYETNRTPTNRGKVLVSS